MEMENTTTIDSKPILDIYGSTDGRYWFVTEKIQKDGQRLFSGYLRTSQMPMLARFYDIPEEKFNSADKRFWKVAKEKWNICPGIKVRNNDGLQNCNKAATKTGSGYLVQVCSNNCKEVDEKMAKNIQEKLDGYLQLFDGIRARVDDERTALALLQEISKDRRMEEIQKEHENQRQKPATEKQKRFMEKLGIKYPKNVTKQEASVLIDEELAKNGEEN